MKIVFIDGTEVEYPSAVEVTLVDKKWVLTTESNGDNPEVVAEIDQADVDLERTQVPA